MNIIIFLLLVVLDIYMFVKKPQISIAILLVGQPILKLCIVTFPISGIGNVAIAFFALLGISSYFIANKKTVIIINEKKKNAIMALIAIIFLVILSVLSGLIALIRNESSYVLSKLLDFSIQVIPSAFLVILFLNAFEDFHELCNAISIISLVVGIFTIIAVYVNLGTVLVRTMTYQTKDVSLFGVNFATSIWFGRRMGLGAVSTLFSSIKNPYKSIIFTILSIFVILSVSRGPIIAYIIVLLIIFRKRLGKTKVLADILIISVAAVIVIGGLFFDISSPGFESTVFARLFAFDDNNAQSRLRVISTAFDIFRNNILGIGLGNFRNYALLEYPHNIMLEIMTEWGIIGFIGFLWLVLNCLKKALKKLNSENDPENSYTYYFLLCFSFALINALFSGDISSNEYIWIFMILFWLLPNSFSKKIHNDNASL